MIPIPTGVRVWLATGHTDMRKGCASLSLQVQEVFRRDPLSGHLFCFRGRRGDLIKVIWHDWQGACLFCRRFSQQLKASIDQNYQAHKSSMVTGARGGPPRYSIQALCRTLSASMRSFHLIVSSRTMSHDCSAEGCWQEREAPAESGGKPSTFRDARFRVLWSLPPCHPRRAPRYAGRGPPEPSACSLEICRVRELLLSRSRPLPRSYP